MITEDILMDIAIQADNEGLINNEEPKLRHYNNISRILKIIKQNNINCSNDIENLAIIANNRLFRQIDKRNGGVHLGFFMFRDLFCNLSIPLIFGEINVNFIRYLDLSEYQKDWMSKSPHEMEIFIDQALDLFDFGYGSIEFGNEIPAQDLSKQLIYQAKIHLEAAAATATNAFNYGGTLQSALLGTELALKAGLANRGYDENRLRQEIGHDIQKAADKLGMLEANFDIDRVKNSISSFPNYSQSRYNGIEPERIEMGNIIMKAQYVASEVTRAFTHRNIRIQNPAFRNRLYPSL